MSDDISRIVSAPVSVIPHSRYQTVVRFIWHHRIGATGAMVLLAYAFIALVVPAIVPRSPNTLSDVALSGPTARYPFGTDNLGRDLLSRCLIGIRISVTVGLLASAMALVAGSFVGLISGYTGGVVDAVIMRVSDVLIAFPALLLAIAVVAAFGAGEVQVSLAISLVFFPVFARLARAGVLNEREREYVLASRAAGAGPARILFIDISRNVTAPLILQAALSVGFAVILEAALSFLGLGLRPPTPSLGSIISGGRSYMQDNVGMVLIPGTLLTVLVFSLQATADLLGDWLDPRSQRTG